MLKTNNVPFLAYDTEYDYSDNPSQYNALTQDTESYGSQGYDGSVELTPSSVQENNNSYLYGSQSGYYGSTELTPASPKGNNQKNTSVNRSLDF